MADIKVRVGQQNTVKVVSSISGSSGGKAVTAENVIGGIASVSKLNVTGISTLTQLNVTGISTLSRLNVTGISTLSRLNVSGVSTFVGLATFRNDVYINGNLYVSNDLVFDEYAARNANITGILTVGNSFYYPPGQPYGVAYFDNNDLLVSTGSTSVAITETNYILSTNSLGVPTWSSVIDGGEY